MTTPQKAATSARTSKWRARVRGVRALRWLGGGCHDLGQRQAPHPRRARTFSNKLFGRVATGRLAPLVQRCARTAFAIPVATRRRAHSRHCQLRADRRPDAPLVRQVQVVAAVHQIHLERPGGVQGADRRQLDLPERARASCAPCSSGALRAAAAAQPRAPPVPSRPAGRRARRLALRQG